MLSNIKQNIMQNESKSIYYNYTKHIIHKAVYIIYTIPLKYV